GSTGSSPTDELPLPLGEALSRGEGCARARALLLVGTPHPRYARPLPEGEAVATAPSSSATPRRKRSAAKSSKARRSNVSPSKERQPGRMPPPSIGKGRRSTR